MIPWDEGCGWSPLVSLDCVGADDLEIGSGASMDPGLTIGVGARFRVGSAGARDVALKVFASGNPCRVVNLE